MAGRNPGHFTQLFLMTKQWLFKELLVQAFDGQRLFSPTTYIVADHELGEHLSVDQNNSLTKFLHGFDGGA